MVVGLCHEVSKGALHFGIIGRIFIKLGFDFSGADHELITDAFHAMELFDLGDALVASTNELRQKLDPLNICRLEAFDGVFVDQLYDCARKLHKRLVSTRIDLSVFIFDSGLLHLIL